MEFGIPISRIHLILKTAALQEVRRWTFGYQAIAQFRMLTMVVIYY